MNDPGNCYCCCCCSGDYGEGYDEGYDEGCGGSCSGDESGLGRGCLGLILGFICLCMLVIFCRLCISLV